MKNYRFLTLFLLFSGFLLPGFWAGRQIGNQSQGLHSGESKLPSKAYINESQPVEMEGQRESLSQSAPLPPLPSKPADSSEGVIIHQRNILVIGVDRLDASSPNLESVWLIIYMPNTPHFMLLPIYPTKPLTDGNISTMGEMLTSAFQLDSDQIPHPSFLEALQAQELWWNEYILLDEIALAKVVDFIGDLDNTQNLDGVGVIGSVPISRDDPLGALVGQAELVQNLCRRTTHLSTVGARQYLHLFESIQDHVRSDLNLEQAVTEWQGLLVHGGNISCEFPTLAAPIIHP